LVLGTGLIEVRIVKESGKQDKVGKVHKKAELDVLIANVAFKAILLHLVSPNIYQTAYNHLDQL
jgi:hypothetical protein